VNARISFNEQLVERWHSRQSMLCVGLDPDPQRLPAAYLSNADSKGDAVLAFCCDIVDATADSVCAFKPQFAYFAAAAAESQLAELIRYIHQRHPDIPVILDAKRGDIGATAEQYAIEAFERFAADAVTVNPYLGEESVRPYLEYADRGTIVLCRTSNPDSDWLQNHPADDPIYLKVARSALGWNRNNNVLLVAGATYSEELARIRETVGDMTLLVPGVGAQGGDLAAVLEQGSDANGYGLIINAARSILYADAENAGAGAAGEAAKIVDEMRRLQRKVAPDRAMV
jgi:orotidine-5'-phosphate decarboxylase